MKGTSESSKIWYLENIDIFKEMPKKMMQYVEEHTQMCFLKKGEYIYFNGDESNHVYFVKMGRVKVCAFSPNEGKEIIKVLLGSGEFFGEQFILGQKNRDDFAQALDNNTLLCKMPAEEFEQLMAENIDLTLRVTKLIGFRLKKVERRLESLIFKDSRSRIVDFLKDLAEEKGERVGFETVVRNFGLTHKDISNLTATSRQTVTTVLNDLRSKNLIYFDRKRILFRDLEGMA